MDITLNVWDPSSLLMSACPMTLFWSSIIAPLVSGTPSITESSVVSVPSKRYSNTTYSLFMLLLANLNLTASSPLRSYLGRYFPSPAGVFNGVTAVMYFPLSSTVALPVALSITTDFSVYSASDFTHLRYTSSASSTLSPLLTVCSASVVSDGYGTFSNGNERDAVLLFSSIVNFCGSVRTYPLFALHLISSITYVP